MKKRKFLLIVLSFLFMTSAWAQETTVSGKVVDETNFGLPGVSIVEKGTTNGTTTDFDGNYTLTGVPSDAVLVYSFVGFTPQEVPVNGQTSINITMAEDMAALEEVVVIGYGTVKAKDATGAVSSVKAEDFNGGVISSPEQLIQGKTAGVQITSTSGEPGAGVNIRIRGTSSVRSGNDPLFVVDGVPLDGGSTVSGGIDAGFGSSASKNPLNFLNPNDIASIDILKDASATAIYGSRGANGVVMITTKKAKANMTTIEYSGSYSISQMANYYDVLEAEDYLTGIAQFGGDANVLNLGAKVDWQREITNPAISHNHNIAYGYGYNNGNIRASVSYTDQRGIVLTSGMEKIAGRLNINHRLFDDKLKLTAQLSASRVNDDFAPISDNSGFEGDILGAAVKANPTRPVFGDKSGFHQETQDEPNPKAMLHFIDDYAETDRLLLSASAEYSFFDFLSFKVNTGYDKSSSTREYAASKDLFLGGGVIGNGIAYTSELETSSKLLEAYLTFNKDLSESSNLTALLGYSYQKFEREGIEVQGFGFDASNMGTMVNDLYTARGVFESSIGDVNYQQFRYQNNSLGVYQLFPDPDNYTVASSVNNIQSMYLNNYNYEDELQSFFGRLNYSLADGKYMFTATLRADGSTKFGEDNKYGIFPALAFAWRLSDEKFIPDAFSNLKLRLGWGVTGNQEIPHNQIVARQRYDGLGIDDGGNITGGGLIDVALNNKDLQWEETEQFNIGLDYGFANNRIYGSIEAYQKTTSKLLIKVTSAQPSPQPFAFVNLDADVVNTGIEFDINTVPIDKENVTWEFGFNVGYNKNEVKNYEGGIIETGTINGQGLSLSFAQAITNNQPLYSYYVRPFAGYSASGIAEYVDGADFQVFTGDSPFPDFTLGITNKFRYKNFDLSAFFTGQFGQKIYNNTANAYFTAGAIGNGRNVTYDVLSSGESNLNAPDVSTRFLEDGSFLRFQDLTLGYNFDMGDSKTIKSLRIYANGQNLFVLTDYSGLDPEVNTDKSRNDVPSLGIDYTSYPRARTYTLGVNVTF